MCIIAAKPAGVDMPSTNILENMWFNNDDGGGFMYALSGCVYIEKGFMKYEDMKQRLDELAVKHDLKSLPMVMHFRITTHGGTKPENCHPFPITDSMGMLMKLKTKSRLGVAHNGIINIEPRKGISDTMEYIASQLAPLSKAAPKFYKNKYFMQMINSATGGKLAFLAGDGKIYTVGRFVEDGGILYSNDSYKYCKSWRNFTYGYFNEDYWELNSGIIDYAIRNVMWLDEANGEFAVSPDGELMDPDECAINSSGMVYVYNYDEDALELFHGARAYNALNMSLKFNPNSQLVTQEIVMVER